MKKWLICLVFGFLLISCLAFALAKAENGQNGANQTQGNVSSNQTVNGENATETDGNASNQTIAGSNVTNGNVSSQIVNETLESNTTKIEDDNETYGSNATGNYKTKVNQTKTRVEDRENITFIPWQKRNESECMEGCKCVGAVVSCESETGKTMTITAGKSGNTIVITIEKTNMTTDLEIEAETTGDNKTKLSVKLSNGSKKELKTMPNEAEKVALERVKVQACNSENNCNLTLKEEKEKLKYELQLERHSRILAIFAKKMQVKTEIDTDTGEVTNVAKPWWAFLATEPRE
jgi:hypothetical protein